MVDKIVIIHGTTGNPEENWFPWLDEKLSAKGFEVTRPHFPTPENQNLGTWLVEFGRQVGRLDENTVLVGHSLAPAFIIRLLEAHQVKVKATFLVAAFVDFLGLEDFDRLNQTFVEGDVNWASVAQLAGTCSVYNSDNDPYVPFEFGEKVAKNLGAKLTKVPNGGHLNTGAGFEEFPQLLGDILDTLS